MHRRKQERGSLFHFRRALRSTCCEICRKKPPQSNIRCVLQRLVRMPCQFMRGGGGRFSASNTRTRPSFSGHFLFRLSFLLYPSFPANPLGVFACNVWGADGSRKRWVGGLHFFFCKGFFRRTSSHTPTLLYALQNTRNSLEETLKGHFRSASWIWTASCC
jgi:hypothetical protein